MEQKASDHAKDICVSEPVKKIIVQVAAEIKNGSELSMKHDHWVDQPSHDHYRDASGK